MNDQSQLINQGPVFSQPPPQVVLMNPTQQLLGASKAMSQPQIRAVSQPPPPQMLGQRQSQVFAAQSMLSRGGYKPWPPRLQLQQQLGGMDPSAKFRGSKPGFGALKQQGRGNWKGKKANDNRVDLRKAPNPSVNAGMVGAVGAGSYKPPSLNELQNQNHLKARKFYPKKKFNNRFAPYAPRNTSSFIMRAKKSGGIASLVSPSPVTPAVLPTPRFSPTTEVLGDMAKEEWGVDGYGSMKGLIRLRNEAGFREHDEEEEGEDHEEDDNDGSSESDVEEEEKNSVLSRLDHETSRFEMVYPNYGGDYNNILENRVDDQDAHIAQLEEENLTLKERLFLMERELGDLRKRLQLLERQNQGMDYVNEEVVENVSENDSGGGSDIHGMECESKEEVMEYGDGNVGTSIDAGNDSRRENNDLAISEGGRDVSMDVYAPKLAMPEDGHLKGGEMQDENMPVEASTEQDEVKRTGQMRDLATAEVDVNKHDIKDEDVGTVHSEKSIGDGD